MRCLDTCVKWGTPPPTSRSCSRRPSTLQIMQTAGDGREMLGPQALLLGCTGGASSAEATEIEQEPAVSITVAACPA